MEEISQERDDDEGFIEGEDDVNYDVDEEEEGGEHRARSLGGVRRAVRVRLLRG